jgi:hypothetical protein
MMIRKFIAVFQYSQFTEVQCSKHLIYEQGQLKAAQILFFSNIDSYRNVIKSIAPLSCILFTTQRSGSEILSPSSGGTYSFGPNK